MDCTRTQTRDEHRMSSNTRKDKNTRPKRPPVTLEAVFIHTPEQEVYEKLKSMLLPENIADTPYLKGARCSQKSYTLFEMRGKNLLAEKRWKDFQVLLLALRYYAKPTVKSFKKFNEFGLPKMMLEWLMQCIPQPSLEPLNDLLRDFVKTIEAMSAHSEPMKTSLHILVQSLLELSADNHKPVLVRYEVVNLLIDMIQSCEMAKKDELLGGQLAKESLMHLGTTLKDIGDYELQVSILELLFCFPDVDEFWFNNKSLADQYRSIRAEKFDIDCRYFLNNLNKVNQSVYSLECKSLQAGSSVLNKPAEMNELWIDFNTQSQCISFSIDDKPATEWKTIYIKYYEIQYWKNIAKPGVWELSVTLCVPLPPDLTFDHLIMIFHENPRIPLIHSIGEDKELHHVHSTSTEVHCPKASTAMVPILIPKPTENNCTLSTVPDLCQSDFFTSQGSAAPSSPKTTKTPNTSTPKQFQDDEAVPTPECPSLESNPSISTSSAASSKVILNPGTNCASLESKSVTSSSLKRPPKLVNNSCSVDDFCSSKKLKSKKKKKSMYQQSTTIKSTTKPSICSTTSNSSTAKKPSLDMSVFDFPESPNKSKSVHKPKTVRKKSKAAPKQLNGLKRIPHYVQPSTKKSQRTLNTCTSSSVKPQAHELHASLDNSSKNCTHIDETVLASEGTTLDESLNNDTCVPHLSSTPSDNNHTNGMTDNHQTVDKRTKKAETIKDLSISAECCGEEVINEESVTNNESLRESSLSISLEVGNNDQSTIDERTEINTDHPIHEERVSQAIDKDPNTSSTSESVGDLSNIQDQSPHEGDSNLDSYNLDDSFMSVHSSQIQTDIRDFQQMCQSIIEDSELRGTSSNGRKRALSNNSQTALEAESGSTPKRQSFTEEPSTTTPSVLVNSKERFVDLCESVTDHVISRFDNRDFLYSFDNKLVKKEAIAESHLLNAERHSKVALKSIESMQDEMIASDEILAQIKDLHKKLFIDLDTMNIQDEKRVRKEQLLLMNELRREIIRQAHDREIHNVRQQLRTCILGCQLKLLCDQ